MLVWLVVLRGFCRQLLDFLTLTLYSLSLKFKSSPGLGERNKINAEPINSDVQTCNERLLFLVVAQHLPFPSLQQTRNTAPWS